jgi:hypothetical protein
VHPETDNGHSNRAIHNGEKSGSGVARPVSLKPEYREALERTRQREAREREERRRNRAARAASGPTVMPIADALPHVLADLTPPAGGEAA